MPKGNTTKIATLTANLVTDKTAYLALFATNPGGTGTGTEINYTGYVRQQISWGTPGINGGVAEIKNTNLIEFETVPAASGITTHAAIFDGSSGGTLLYYTALGVSYALEAGVKPTIPIGNLAVYES